MHIVVPCVYSVLGPNDFLLYGVSTFCSLFIDEHFTLVIMLSVFLFFFRDIVFSFFLEIYESGVTYALFMVTQYLAF